MLVLRHRRKRGIGQQLAILNNVSLLSSVLSPHPRRPLPKPEFAYDYLDYLDNSHLLDTITGPQHTVSNSYEPYRDLRTRVSSDIDGDPQNNAFMLDYQYSYIPVKVAWARGIPSMNSISKSNLPLRAGKES